MLRLGVPVDAEILRPYARLGQEMSALDSALVRDLHDRTEMAERLTLVMVLYERVFIALHRLAQEDLSARTYGREQH